MNFLVWLPSISTALLLALVWLFRVWILTRLKESVKYEFDVKIEGLRAEHQKNVESFKADLRAKDAQIEALRSVALSGLANRQEVLNKRRVEAVEEIWSAVRALKGAENVSETMNKFMVKYKFEEMIKRAPQEPEIRAIFNAYFGGKDYDRYLSIDASKARPFVSENTWALFSAYQAMLSLAVTKAKLLQNELYIGFEFIITEHVSKLIEVALPHRTKGLQELGELFHHYLLEELKSRILEELQKILNGEESDKETIERAAKIRSYVEKVTKSSSEDMSALDNFTASLCFWLKA